jgi:glucose 1-dehydrogenase
MVNNAGMERKMPFLETPFEVWQETIAINLLMRTLAVELAPHNITVNNIAPGAIETPMDAPLEEHPAQMKELLSEIPLGRMGKPEEVANLALFLASDDTSYVTGSTLFVDGGMIRHSGTL